MTSEKFNLLLEHFKADTITQQEWEELRSALLNPEMQTLLNKDMANAFEEEHVHPAWTPERKQYVLDIINRRITPVKSVYAQIKWWWAAAVILFASGLGIFLWNSSNHITHLSHSVITNSSPILPGRSGAVLTLADDSKVLLDTVQNGIVALQGGKKARVRNGALVYEGTGDEVVYNTMYTPNGRQFHLVLPDGTEVWLNNASSIRFPTQFTGDERKVDITGEAYFEVAPNRQKPFNVNVNNKARVTVLGTRFNVNAYTEEGSINTTLIEGSVKVSVDPSVAVTPATHPYVVLKQGQQAKLAATQQHHSIQVVSNVDIENVIAWKNGFFNFKDVPFKESMRQIARWYNIEILYPQGIPESIELNGEITMGVTLNDLLAGFKDIGLKFRLEGRQLSILK